ncbi:hypothetical protein [Anaerotruncus rubiinfantis]|uniref:hypothetical protein n=1 Tax=Anaerotruncus rubiinfantis TaxID=1720200 RepID=UPI00189BF3D5|nr:hypothetical protein [Anaerotruncus rubiinfantis]
MPMTLEERREALIEMVEQFMGEKVDREQLERLRAQRSKSENTTKRSEPSLQELPKNPETTCKNCVKINLGMLSFKEWKQTGKCLESELAPEELAALRKSKK